MEGHRSVLIAANGSRAALNEGLRIAEQGNCWVTVLGVVPRYEGDIDLTSVSNIREVLDSGRSAIALELEETVRGESAARVRVEQGDIQETIRRVAIEEASDIIVMGVRKDASLLRRQLDRLLLGRIRRVAPCPVMTVDA